MYQMGQHGKQTKHRSPMKCELASVLDIDSKLGEKHWYPISQILDFIVYS